MTRSLGEALSNELLSGENRGTFRLRVRGVALQDAFMLPNPDTAVGRLFARLSDWISLDEFEQALSDYFHGHLGTRSLQIIVPSAARSKSFEMKQHHVKFVKAKRNIRFELNDAVPYCWLRTTEPPRGLWSLSHSRASNIGSARR
ncbi:hypothetical protein [Bradyrhizobium sp. B117]|uniref:hypothetical protein n=1 Tax=Bradyrhizobium sp. B117 TaxID=3140246 RepID=UPI003183DA88